MDGEDGGERTENAWFFRNLKSGSGRGTGGGERGRVGGCKAGGGMA